MLSCCCHLPAPVACALDRCNQAGCWYYIFLFRGLKRKSLTCHSAAVGTFSLWMHLILARLLSGFNWVRPIPLAGSSPSTPPPLMSTSDIVASSLFRSRVPPPGQLHTACRALTPQCLTAGCLDQPCWRTRDRTPMSPVVKHINPPKPQQRIDVANTTS